jgi:hypothetical protein
MWMRTSDVQEERKAIQMTPWGSFQCSHTLRVIADGGWFRRLFPLFLIGAILLVVEEGKYNSNQQSS